MNLEVHAAAVELDIVVPSESVGKSMQASSGVLAAQPLSLGDLHLVVHPVLSVVELAGFLWRLPEPTGRPSRVPITSSRSILSGDQKSTGSRGTLALGTAAGRRLTRSRLQPSWSRRQP